MMLTPDDVYDVEFRKARRRDRGYDERAVDQFLDRVAATLRDEDTLTAHDVLSVRLPPRQPGRRAYGQRGVNRFLEKVALTLVRQGKAGGAEDPSHRESEPGSEIEAQPVVVPEPPAITPAPEPTPEPQPPPKGSFPSVAPGQPAYDEDEVDAFIGRVEATLRGEDTLTAEDLLSARFSPPQPGRSGYHEGGVAVFLRSVATSLAQLRPRPIHQLPENAEPSRLQVQASDRTQLTADDVHHVTLNAPPRGQEGYDLDEVDDFLDRVEGTLRGNDTLTSTEVRNARFSASVPDTGGYDVDEVEGLLGLVERRLAGQEPRVHPISAASGQKPQTSLDHGLQHGLARWSGTARPSPDGHPAQKRYTPQNY